MEQQQYQRQEDDLLTGISSHLTTLHAKTIDINEELTTQNKDITNFQGEIDNTQEDMDFTNRRLDRFLENSKKCCRSNWFCIVFLMLALAAVILFLILIYG